MKNNNGLAKDKIWQLGGVQAGVREEYTIKLFTFFTKTKTNKILNKSRNGILLRFAFNFENRLHLISWKKVQPS